MDELIALLRYFGVVFVEGDWLNDWLTWLPDEIAQAAVVIGQWIAPIFN